MLVNGDTEIYVAPRPRDAPSAKPVEAPKAVITPAASSASSKGKSPAKEASATLRVVPGRVGSKWGVPVLAALAAQVVGTDRVGWVSPSALNKIRRRLGHAQDGEPVYVGLRREKEQPEEDDREKKEGAPEGEAKEGEQEVEEELPLEAWLVGWDEVPRGCVVLAGEVDPTWSSWAQAK